MKSGWFTSKRISQRLLFYYGGNILITSKLYSLCLLHNKNKQVFGCSSHLWPSIFEVEQPDFICLESCIVSAIKTLHASGLPFPNGLLAQFLGESSLKMVHSIVSNIEKM